MIPLALDIYASILFCRYVDILNLTFRTIALVMVLVTATIISLVGVRVSIKKFYIYIYKIHVSEKKRINVTL